eukprot:scpid36105/ scgid33722/ 
MKSTARSVWLSIAAKSRQNKYYRYSRVPSFCHPQRQQLSPTDLPCRVLPEDMPATNNAAFLPRHGQVIRDSSAARLCNLLGVVPRTCWARALAVFGGFSRLDARALVESSCSRTDSALAMNARITCILPMAV